MKKVIFALSLLAVLSAGNVFKTKDLVAAQDSGYTCPDGQDHLCSDGHYHAPNGDIQPDHCDNAPNGPNKDNPTMDHDCMCERTSDMCDTRGDVSRPGAKCKTYCRPKQCNCASKCDS